MQHKSSGKGCGTGIILSIVVYFIFLLNEELSSQVIPMFCIIAFIIAVSIYIEMRIGKKVDKLKENVSVSMLELENSQKEKRKNLQNQIIATYIQGHHAFSNTNFKGNIALDKESLLFFVDEKSVEENEFYVNQVKEIFSIPYCDIVDIMYDVSEKVTVGRFILIGIASFVFKKQTYYLIINYNNKGIVNQVIFETGKNKEINFFNQLNTRRNAYVNTDNVKESIITSTHVDEDTVADKLRKLSNLKDEKLITQEEYDERRKNILDNI